MQWRPVLIRLGLERMKAERWEHGSEWHWPTFAPTGSREVAPWHDAGVLYGCGRDALRGLAAYGRDVRGWKRLLVPSYLCQEVVGALIDDGHSVAVYPDRPDLLQPELEVRNVRAGDAVLLVNYFGLRSGAFAPSLPSDVDVVEDHTHDPWSDWTRKSCADFCVVALRKTLPVPDGGVLWSPRGHALPEELPVTEARLRASSEKVTAMVLKALYLEGHRVEKKTYRELSGGAEKHIASGTASGIPPFTRQVLPVLPAAEWRDRRRSNYRRIAAVLDDVPGLSVLGCDGSAQGPFCLPLVFDSPAMRDRARATLLEARIYPAVLWPLNEPLVESIGAADRELSARLLCLHCDARYGAADMDRVLEAVRRAAR